MSATNKVDTQSLIPWASQKKSRKKKDPQMIKQNQLLMASFKNHDTSTVHRLLELYTDKKSKWWINQLNGFLSFRLPSMCCVH